MDDLQARSGKSGNRTISQLIGEGARVLPEKSHGWFRTWFRKVWRVRGGGLYALGFAGFFIIFEVASLGDDLADVGSLFNGQAIGFIIEVVVDSFKNTLKALMWPVYVVQLAPPWGAIGLGLAFIAFTRYLKQPIEKWLFRDESTDNHQGP